MPKKKLKQKIDSAISDKGVISDYRGSLEYLAQEMLDKREGIYIAYDDDLFEVIYELAHELKKEPAFILILALKKGLLLLVDEKKKPTSKQIKQALIAIDDGYFEIAEEVLKELLEKFEFIDLIGN